MIHTADVGTRVFYSQHGSFDTHASQAPTFDKLWTEVSGAIADFWDDLKEHDADDNVVMFLFSEFGRRVRDNGSGTDHGAAGACFAIGPSIRGGMHGEYPETRPEALEQGDLVPNQDFRGVYSTILEDWLELDPSAHRQRQLRAASFHRDRIIRHANQDRRRTHMALQPSHRFTCRQGPRLLASYVSCHRSRTASCTSLTAEIARARRSPSSPLTKNSSTRSRRTNSPGLRVWRSRP